MSWGTELWDQYDNIATHTQKGIDFLERYGHFVDQRSKIEQEYASKLRRLIKTYLPKKKEEDDYQFTYAKAYKVLLLELGDQAGQHEMIAENLSTSVAQQLSSLVKALKDDRRRHLNEGARIQAQLQSSLNLLSKTKEKYEKAFGASERALDAFQKADDDFNLSRAEVEKHRMNSNVKSQQYDDCKNEYANQLQKTNDLQRDYYNHMQPTVFQSLQDLDERRINGLGNLILKALHSEKQVLPIVSRCLDAASEVAKDINATDDSKTVIEKFKSGFAPPQDIPFEDLTTTNVVEKTSVNGSMSSVPQALYPLLDKKSSIIGTITGGRIRKRSGLLGLFSNSKGSSTNLYDNKDDFSELPPNQRRKKLQAKIEEITSKICQETAARDGLMKMKQVYESNSALGDPMSIQGQLTENGQRLDKLRAELKKFQDFLDDLDGKAPDSPAIRGRVNEGATGKVGPKKKTGNGRSKRRSSSVSDGAESLSRSASDSSVSNKKNGAGNVETPLHSHGSSQSPESGICTSSMSLPSSSNGSNDNGGNGSHSVIADDEDEDEDEFCDADPLPIIGKCKALYHFEVTSEGSIHMDDGEELWIIEADQGDGWTRVRRVKPSSVDPMPEGFVPTSYIETTEMFSLSRPV